MSNSLFPNAPVGQDVPSAKGDMRRLIDAFDWADSPVGPMSSWPAAWLVTTRVMLASPVPMVMLMGEQGVLIYNDGYAAFAGDRHPAILGRPHAEAWPEIAEYNDRALARVLAGEAFSLADQKLTLNRRGQLEDGWMDLDYSPVLDEDGTPVGELVIVSETTKRVVAERTLSRTEESLSFALTVSGMVGVWDWHIAKDIVISDARFAEMFGVDPERAAAGTPIAEFIGGVHPDDREALRIRIEDAIRARGDFRAEYRLMNAAGQIRWVLAIGRVATGPDGKAVRLPGIVVDISERKAVESALTESEAKFRAIADSMPQMVWSTLPDGYHDYYNARWYQFTGVPDGSTDGEGWNGVFHPEDQERAWGAWRHSLATGDPYEIEYRLRHHSGQYRWTLGRALPIRKESGQIVRWMGTLTDIHEARIAGEEREIIAQELSHRIKNIFSVLNGIIGLSARTRPESRAFAEELRGRVRALGQAHDFVRPQSRDSALLDRPSTVSTLFRELLSPYEDGNPGRVTFSGDDASIDDAAATPLALLLHELGTNAAKYGALSTKEGAVALEGRRRDGRYTLIWSERGGPRTERPTREGFGSRLISLSVEGQLGGRIARRWEPEGLVVEVEVPLTSLTRAAKARRAG